MNGKKSKEMFDVAEKDVRKSIRTIAYTYDSNNLKEMTIGNILNAYKHSKKGGNRNWLVTVNHTSS